MPEDLKWNSYAQTRWNPYTGDKMDDGKCEIVKRHGKRACWAYRRAVMLANNPKVEGYDPEDPFKPTFHPDRLNEPLKRKKPTIYATCFMGDIMYAQTGQLDEIVTIQQATPQHTYLMLTKSPVVFSANSGYRIRWPDNVWFGTTVNLQNEIFRIDNLRNVECKHKWVSFEPPFEGIKCDLSGIDFIAVGALTGEVKFQPSMFWVDELVMEAHRKGCKVVIKENMDYRPKLREWP